MFLKPPSSGGTHSLTLFLPFNTLAVLQVAEKSFIFFVNVLNVCSQCTQGEYLVTRTTFKVYRTNKLNLNFSLFSLSVLPLPGVKFAGMGIRPLCVKRALK